LLGTAILKLNIKEGPIKSVYLTTEDSQKQQNKKVIFKFKKRTYDLLRHPKLLLY